MNMDNKIKERLTLDLQTCQQHMDFLDEDQKEKVVNLLKNVWCRGFKVGVQKCKKEVKEILEDKLK